jgi:hypothetical protein
MSRPAVRAIFARVKLPSGINVVECPKGLPPEAIGWCLDGDRAWRPVSEAIDEGLTLRPEKAAPKSRREKAKTPPPLLMD